MSNSSIVICLNIPSMHHTVRTFSTFFISQCFLNRVSNPKKEYEKFARRCYEFNSGTSRACLHCTGDNRLELEFKDRVKLVEHIYVSDSSYRVIISTPYLEKVRGGGGRKRTGGCERTSGPPLPFPSLMRIDISLTSTFRLHSI